MDRFEYMARLYIDHGGKQWNLVDAKRMISFCSIMGQIEEEWSENGLEGFFLWVYMDPDNPDLVNDGPVAVPVILYSRGGISVIRKLTERAYLRNRHKRVLNVRHNPEGVTMVGKALFEKESKVWQTQQH